MKSVVEQAYQRATEMKDLERAAAEYRTVLALAEQSTDTGDRYYRRRCEEMIIELDLAIGDAAALERARGFWLTCARRRVLGDEQQEVFLLALLMTRLQIDSLPPDIADPFARGWAEQRLSVLAQATPLEDGDVAKHWRVDVVPEDPKEARRFARHAYRGAHWAHVEPNARAVIASADASDGERCHARLLLLAALHRAGNGDAALVRAAIDDWLAMAKPKRKRDRWLMGWDHLAALTILHRINDADVVVALAQAWTTAEPHFAAPQVLGVSRSSATPQRRSRSARTRGTRTGTK
jgi:hypothetical protein